MTRSQLVKTYERVVKSAEMKILADMASSVAIKLLILIVGTIMILCRYVIIRFRYINRKKCTSSYRKSI